MSRQKSNKGRGGQTSREAKKSKSSSATKKPAAPKSEKAQLRQIEQQKAARRLMLKRTARTVAIFAVVFVAFLAFSAWNNRERDPVSQLGAAYEQARNQATACGAAAPEPADPMRFEQPTNLGLTGPVTATITTSCGDLVLELDPGLAPASVNSFVFLAEQGFYDRTVVYAVDPALWIQAGDQTAMGEEGAGYRVPDEPPPADVPYERGTVALAYGGGPNRSDSRFVIYLTDDPPQRSLNIIGRVASGEEVLDEIASIDRGLQITGARTRPLQTVYIEKVTIVR